MGFVTITVLQGADRGRVFRDVETPITIGREEGNTVQLNDERISRCHLKIQQDQDRIVLTDLDSTNGTRVNGQECQLRILRFGDVVGLGRSLIRIGTDAEIAERFAFLQQSSQGGTKSVTRDLNSGTDAASSDGFFVGRSTTDQSAMAMLGIADLPGLPENLSPGQAAQVCEILEHLYSRMQAIIEQGTVDETSGQVRLPVVAWQRLLDAQIRVSTLIRRLADPDWDR